MSDPTTRRRTVRLVTTSGLVRVVCRLCGALGVARGERLSAKLTLRVAERRQRRPGSSDIGPGRPPSPGQTCCQVDLTRSFKCVVLRDSLAADVIGV
jgi:hypothetical protein